jgi:hypothetical protein
MTASSRWVVLGTNAALCALVAASCATAPAPRGGLAEPGLYGGGDGLTCANRVIVHAANEKAGADAETAWLLAKYPVHERVKQSLDTCADHPADVIRITVNGQIRDIYFDIFEYYGRF